MNIKLQIDSVLIYSEENDKFFYAYFKDKLNVIYGKNTSGKSTLIQLILFAFGINDNKIKLAEILSEQIFIRLDCSIKKNGEIEKYVFIRQDETLLIRDSNNKVLRFNGISADQSAEHVKLKKYFNELFEFNLQLESNAGITEAPIETIFLPYYVSQEVGWVYLRKSFNNLTYYKNFKEDFLDYYLGIENIFDREEKRRIEKEVNRLQQQIKFYIDIEKDNQDLKLANVIDETLEGKANILIADISTRKDKLLELENTYVNNSNKLTFYNQRLSVVSKVSRNHNKQEPGKDNCPTCTQILPSQIEDVYSFFQKENDTTSLRKELGEKIKKMQSSLNSLNKRIEENRAEIETTFKPFNKDSENNITLKNYIENKANIQLFENLTKQIGQLTIDLNFEKGELKKYKTDDDINIEREKKSQIFKNKYFTYNNELGLPALKDERFYKLYELSTFPFQGVELHKAVLSYHFAFNNLLTQTSDIHRLPFILDSVFKEDIDGGNRIKILKFITKNFPTDTQTILSIADDKNIDSKIEEYKRDIFKDLAHLICIGNGENEKALLKENDNTQKELIEDTFEIIDNI
jgi:energy-coupling factor transporter ATP-binding protein EcfA2